MATQLHQRSGFARTDSDKVSPENENVAPTSATSALDSEKAFDRTPEIAYLGDESPLFDASKEDHFGEAAVLTDAKDVLTHVIHVDDDPSLSPWTFRAFFLGMSQLFPGKNWLTV
jgi:hypothetical protein